jgi:outer membrane protein assembly factor BamB
MVTRFESSNIAYWQPLNSGSWQGGGPVEDSITAGALTSPSGLAAADGNVWLSGLGLQRWDFSAKLDSPDAPSPLVDVQSTKTSPAAVDSQGRAYVVVQTSDGHELRRFAAQANNSNQEAFAVLPGYSSPVGSPLLGEPMDDSPAEVYVVTTSGTVLAFRADTLALLWKTELGVSLSTTAQPLLVGNVLWTAGLRGEMSALRVGSQGLNRSAHWPKAFHDNCNTSSRQATWDNMPGCF